MDRRIVAHQDHGGIPRQLQSRASRVSGLSADQHVLWDLQRSAGNAAVTSLLGRLGQTKHLVSVQRLSLLEVPEGNYPIENTEHGDRIAAEFGWKAEFTPDAENPRSTKLPRDGEFRQHIWGEFRSRKNATVPLAPDEVLVAKKRPLSTSDWLEDAAGTSLIGHRRRPNNLSKYFADKDFSREDKKGPYFRGSDSPGSQVKAGEHVKVDLEFKALLIDAASGRLLLESPPWTAKGEWDRTGEKSTPQPNRRHQPTPPPKLSPQSRQRHP